MCPEFQIGDKVLLAGGEAGTIIRKVENAELPGGVLFIIELDQQRSNGEWCDTALASELERQTKPEWLLAVCPICGGRYRYLSTYRPSTCSKFDCLHEMAMRTRKPRGEGVL
jgi:hypothetical protein